MDNFKSPLRYPGGKKNQYRFITELLRQNSLVDGIYIEPFAGGAGAALELLMSEYVQHIYLNDLDPHIYLFWKTILNQTDEVLYIIKHIDVTVDEWKRQRLIYKQPTEYTDIQVGFSTFFLNRCNRSGILGGRPIGGLDQRGKWKIDARFNRKNLIERIKTISFYKDRIHVFGIDAKVFLETIVQKNCPKKRNDLPLSLLIMGRL